MMRQRSPEWYEARRGFVTASIFQQLNYGPTKADKEAKRWTKTAQRIACDLVTERLGHPLRSRLKTDDMQRGIDEEPFAFEAAKEALAKALQCELYEPVGQWAFVEHYTEEWIGCSPDGIAGDKGTGEWKSPILPIHMQIIENEMLPNVHEDQVQGTLWITGREWCAFASWNSLHPHTKLWLKIVDADPFWREANVPRILAFRDYVGELYERHAGI